MRKLGVALVLLAVGSGIAGCKRKPTTTVAEAAAPPPAARCLDLPGAHRRELHASADRKTLYYAERAEPISFTTFGSRKETRPSYDLYRVLVDGGTPTRVTTDVEDVAIASTGEVVFTRIVKEGQSYERAKGLFIRGGGGEPRAVDIPTEEGSSALTSSVTSFAIDEKGKQVLFVAGTTLFGVPLTGGTAKKLGSAVIVWGTTPDGRALVRSTLLSTSAVALDGTSKATDVGSDGYSLRVVGDRIVFVSRSKDPTPLQSMPLAGGATSSIAWSKADDRIVEADGPRIFVRRSEAKRVSLVAGDVSAVTSIVETSDASFDGAVDLGSGASAVLVQWDTDGWNGLDEDDESDVCILPATAVPLPPRHFAKKDVTAGAALAKAATDDLADAKITIRHGKYDIAVFEVASAGPTDPEALRQRAKTLQASVAKLTGIASLGARIEFTKNDVAAVAYFHPTDPAKLLLGGGKKDRLQYVHDQYDVELDPGTLLTTGEYGSGDVGSYHCRGTVKNNGTTPLTVKIHCKVDGVLVWEEESATTPATIAPGATGKYDFYAGPGKDTDTVSTTVLRDGAEVPYFNAFADRKAKEGK